MSDNNHRVPLNSETRIHKMSISSDRHKMSTSCETLESLMSQLGEIGKYQYCQVFLLFLASWASGAHTFSLLVTAPVPEHRCLVPWLENDTTLPWDSEVILSAIPKQKDGSLSSCQIYLPGTNVSTNCKSWVYNTTYFTYSRAMQWEMVCDKSWMVALAQSFYMAGLFVGSISCGTLADKFGRKTVYWWSAIFQIIVSIGIAFVNEYTLFLAANFIYGIVGTAGPFGTAIVLTMELVGASKRTLGSILHQAVFAAGLMTAATWAAILKDSTYVQLVIGAHSLLLSFQWWILDESPRWLWSQGRFAESVDIVAKGVRMNGGPELDKAYYISKGKAKSSAEEEPSAGLSLIFKTPRMRAKSLNIMYCWFANNMAYYGVSLGVNKLEGNPFTNLFIMGIVELPSVLVAFLLLDRIGRRSVTSGLLIFSGLVCTIAILLPADMSTLKSICLFTGKFCLAGSSTSLIIYSGELFPTVARNSGIGMGSTVSGFAAMITPAVSLLDILDKRLHIMLYSAFALTTGFFVLFLPETMHQPLPETLEDGENFGAGDNAFVSGCFPNRPKKCYIAAKPV